MKIDELEIREKDLQVLVEMLVWHVYHTGGLRPGTVAAVCNGWVDTLSDLFGAEGLLMAQTILGRAEFDEQYVRGLDRKFKYGPKDDE